MRFSFLIWRTLFLAILFGLISPAFTQVQSQKIRHILINRKNLFDGTPFQKDFPFSLANRLHIVTKESFIRREILFQEGNFIDLEKLEESERILRRRPIFRSVVIQAQVIDEESVDILIETQDVWTTSIQLTYGAAGGENYYRFGILENNFLGQGMVVGAYVRQDADRFGNGYFFRDRQFLKTRWELASTYAGDNKGNELVVDLSRPYFSRYTPSSQGVQWRKANNEIEFYRDRNIISKFDQKEAYGRAFYSHKIVESSDKIIRWFGAYEFDESRFSNMEPFSSIQLPQRRTHSVILSGFEFSRQRFIKEQGLFTFDRVEDINLGWQATIEGGPSLKSLGATHNSIHYRTKFTKNFSFFPKQYWMNHYEYDSRYESGKTIAGTSRLVSFYFFKDWWKSHTAFSRLEYKTLINPDPEDQLLLGGENGLRGYSIRQFDGNKKVLLTLEDRQILLYDWLSLMHWGWAVFADMGVIAREGEKLSMNKVKSNVGLGLRFAPSRSVDPGFIRIDVAYALQNNDRKSRLIFNIGASLGFGEKNNRKFKR
ncbi:MAG: hypothetical protein ACKVQC_06665 [Elusimicrobiota bacterium]